MERYELREPKCNVTSSESELRPFQRLDHLAEQLATVELDATDDERRSPTETLLSDRTVRHSYAGRVVGWMIGREFTFRVAVCFEEPICSIPVQSRAQ